MFSLKKVFCYSCFAVLLGASQAARADLIATDWQSVGDAKATLDTDSGLEWLDVSITDNMSINQVESLLSTTFAGWRLPSYAEVQQLFRNAFKTTIDRNWDVTIDGPDYETFLYNFGFTYSNYVSYGTYLSEDGNTVYAGGTGGSAYGKIYTNYTYGNDANTAVIYAGVFLVSDGGVTLSSQQNPTLNINNPNAPVNQTADVNAPVSAPLAALLLAGWACVRRTAKKQ